MKTTRCVELVRMVLLWDCRQGATSPRAPPRSGEASSEADWDEFGAKKEVAYNGESEKSGDIVWFF